MKKKQKKDCIKHKLWGQLQERAHNYYKIFPVHESEYYRIYYLSEGGYTYNQKDPLYSLEDAKLCIKVKRNKKFYELCEEALYWRKYKRVTNL